MVTSFGSLSVAPKLQHRFSAVGAEAGEFGGSSGTTGMATGVAAAAADAERHVTAALGNSWSHSVNTRLIVEYDAMRDVRRVKIAKSPVAPCAQFRYTIQSGGVFLLDPAAGDGCVAEPPVFGDYPVIGSTGDDVKGSTDSGPALGGAAARITVQSTLQQLINPSQNQHALLPTAAP